MLQGYIRLLQRGRLQNDSEGTMLAAMLDATGKLSAIARQASELGHWLQARHDTPLGAIDLMALDEAMARLNQRHEITTTYASPPTRTTQQTHEGDDTSMLAATLLAIADAVAREAGSNAAIVNVRDGANGVLTVDIHAATPRPAPAAAAPGQSRHKPFFAHGGLGLALVSASYVLDAYRGSFARADADGALQLTFPLDGGAAL